MTNLNIYYIHGSPSSLDLDVFVVVNPLDHMSTDALHNLCKDFEDELMGIYPGRDINVNLIAIERGVVVWCFKGTVDEVNNGLFFTYGLHEQRFPRLLVERRVPRDFELKALRAVRVILSFLSRTPFREMIKEALRGDILHKLKVLDTIDLAQITELGNKNVEFKDYLKTISFQMGQVLGLILNKELYTKESIAQEFPRLKPFLFREDEYDLSVIDYYKSLIVKILIARKWKRTHEQSEGRVGQ